MLQPFPFASVSAVSPRADLDVWREESASTGLEVATLQEKIGKLHASMSKEHDRSEATRRRHAHAIREYESREKSLKVDHERLVFEDESTVPAEDAAKAALAHVEACLKKESEAYDALSRHVSVGGKGSGGGTGRENTSSGVGHEHDRDCEGLDSVLPLKPRPPFSLCLYGPRPHHSHYSCPSAPHRHCL